MIKFKFQQNKVIFLLLVVILILSSVLRYYGVRERSLSVDEMLHVNPATKTNFSEFVSSIRIYPTKAPLYYLLLHLFASVNNSEVSIRMPSIISGVLAVLIIFWIASMLFGYAEGLVSALILSFSILAIAISQSAKTYSVVMAAEFLCIFIFYKYVTAKKQKILLLILYSIVTIFMLLLDYRTFFVILFQFVFLLVIQLRYLFKRRAVGIFKYQIPSFKYYFFALFFIFSITFLWVLFIDLHSESFQTTSILKRSILSFSLQPFIKIFTVTFLKYIFVGLTRSSGIMLMVLVLFFAIGILGSIKKYKMPLLYLILWFIIPVYGLIILFYETFAKSYVDIFKLNHVIFILGAFIILSSRGIVVICDVILNKIISKKQYIKPALRSFFAFSFVGIFLSFNCGSLFEYYRLERQDYRRIGSFLKNNIKGNDIILFNEGRDFCYPIEPLYYYLPKNTPLITVDKIDTLYNLLNDKERDIWGIVVVSSKQARNIYKYHFKNSFSGIFCQDELETLGVIYNTFPRPELNWQPHDQNFQVVYKTNEWLLLHCKYKNIEFKEKLKSLLRIFTEPELPVGSANNLKAMAYLGLAKISAIENNFEDTRNNLKNVITLNPNSWILENAAKTFEGINDIESTINTYKLIGDNAGLRCKIGFAYLTKNNFVKAETEFFKATELDPKFWDSYAGLGEIYSLKGECIKAIKYYKKAVELQPSHSLNVARLGNVYLQANMVDKARSCYERALKLDPKSVQAYEGLAFVYQRKGKPKKAIDCYKSAIKYCSSQPLYYIRLGDIYRSTGNLDEAITQYKRAIEVNPKFKTSYLMLSEVFQNKGMSKESEYYKNLAK